MKYFLLIVLLILLSPLIHANFIPKISSQDDIRERMYRLSAGDRPYAELAVHNIGNVWLTVTNYGQFGTITPGNDPVTGAVAPSCIYPANSGLNYLYIGAFWIGAIVGRDTLVSVGIDDYYSVAELWPDPEPKGIIARRSIQSSNQFYSSQAISEQDIIAVYTDTVTNSSLVGSDSYDGRPHSPLGIEITQRSFAWSYEYAQDFILFDYGIKNIGRKKLEQVYMGIYVDGDVHHTSLTGAEAYGEDMCGFLRTFPADIGCNMRDTVNIAYIMDNDGDPTQTHTFGTNSPLGAAGVRVVRTPSDSLSYSFNWWATNYSAADDFGPRMSGTPDDPFRDMNGILGTPLGDRNKYYILRHKEFDYDQMETALDHTSDGWLPRPADAVDMANGFDARYLLSFGPFNINPGEVLPVTFAFVCGNYVHVMPDDFIDYFNPNQPDVFYSKLDFSNLARNAIWASWIYDNPNYDTDGDGYKGKYRYCCSDSTINIDNNVNPPETTMICNWADTVYYQGDGVPDFRGASPPFPPILRVIPRVNEFNEGELVVRWNGLKSETEKDIFSNQYDFEGYRIYQSLSSRPGDFTMTASYDKEDYNRYYYNTRRGTWQLSDSPFTIDSLRKLYGTEFSPLAHGIDNPMYVVGSGGSDTIYYFSRQDWNASDLLDTTKIHKRFPSQPFPSTLDLDSAAIHYPDELIEDSLFKYFEYEYTLRNLLPSRLYFLSVTAFDYGSPGHGLGALESSISLNVISEYPQNPSNLVEENKLKVVVYPNPYKINGNYRSMDGGGFEGRGEEDKSIERIRAIHFTNLPHKCTIRIYSIDGDLIRRIDHNYPPGSNQSMHDKWDLITRNTQAVASGIYYYSVESEWGNQIGKIVIIK